MKGFQFSMGEWFAGCAIACILVAAAAVMSPALLGLLKTLFAVLGVIVALAFCIGVLWVIFGVLGWIFISLNARFQSNRLGSFDQAESTSVDELVRMIRLGCLMIAMSSAIATLGTLLLFIPL